MSTLYGNFVVQSIKDRIEYVKNKFGWEFPCSEIEDYFIEFIKEIGVDSESAPSEVVDNAIVNGSYGIYSDFYETEEEAIKAYEDGDILYAVESDDGNLYVVQYF